MNRKMSDRKVDYSEGKHRKQHTTATSHRKRPKPCSTRSCTLLKLFCLSQSITNSHGWARLKLTSRIVSTSGTVSWPASYGDRFQASTSSKGRRIIRRVQRLVSFRSSSTSHDDADLGSLKSENSILRDTIRQLEEENLKLKQRVKRVVGLEQFEGERFFRDEMDTLEMYAGGGGSGLAADNNDNDSFLEELWCDESNTDECPIEPTISFTDALRDRAYWLVGLLLMQSFSGIILSRNEALLANHPAIIFFLTMLVGAGGNAGNQASVRVIRGLALGTLNDKTRGQFLTREFKMAAALSMILSIAGFCRAIFFKTDFPEALAVTAALCIIVFSSVCLGAILPIILERFGVDPAHSSTTIQVIMDILGVILAVTISRTILDGPFGAFLIAKLSAGS